MLAGGLYDALDPDFVRDRNRARDLCQSVNATRESDREMQAGLGAAALLVRFWRLRQRSRSTGIGRVFASLRFRIQLIDACE